jgi:hypothetical protein
VALQLLPLLARLRDHERRTAYAEILIRFLQAGDSSLFGLVNAVTSLARDTGDPQRRWRLEELGGALVRAPRPAPERSGGAVKDIANATTPS